MTYNLTVFFFLFLSLDVHNYVDDYSGTLGVFATTAKRSTFQLWSQVLNLLHCLKFLLIIVLETNPINKLDENERNINTLLSGNDQLHLEANKKIFAIVHDLLRQPTACKSVKVYENLFMIQAKKYTF